jgi:cobalt/nickel transport system permease protein
VLHPFGAEQGIGEFLHRTGFALHHHYLQTVVMIQMHMHGRKNVVKVGVLKIGQLLVQQPHVMIVDQRDGSHYVGIRAFPQFFDQLVADQVSKGFRAVSVSARGDQVIEFLQQAGVDRHSNPAKIAHGYSQISGAGIGRQGVTRFRKSCYFETCGAMHIPDNFLSPPVWATLDAIAIPAVGYMVRQAGRQLDDTRIPLLGVMGAFVFAAQMINFPVGIGTSGHLVGGALLAYTLGPAPAVLVMTVIIAIQAFVFQDGGVLALGANVFNMAVVGVLAAYWPLHVWGARWRRPAIFAGAFLSVMVSGSLALGELLMSGVAMPRPMVIISLALFAASAAIEGAITIAVIRAMEKLDARFVPQVQASNRRTLAVLGGSAIALGAVGFLVASAAPDGIERLGIQLGLTAKTVLHAPLADYTFGSFVESAWVRRATAGLSGLLLIYALCAATARWLVRRRSA